MMVTNWFAPKPTDSAQDYGRALLRTRRLHRMDAIITEFTNHATKAERATIMGRIAYEPMAHPADTRLTLKEAIAFHALHIAQIAAKAGISEHHLSRIAACQYVPSPAHRNRIAAALDMTPAAIRWPAYRDAQEVA